jgi:predicted nucleic acid-binding protein
MRILFDTNVILDFLLDRQPFNVTAAWLVNEVDLGRLEGFLGATTITTLYYVARCAPRPDREVRSTIRALLTLFKVAPVNEAVLQQALGAPLNDFEDAVLQEAARLVGAEGIVTRNPHDFRQATLQIYTPEALRLYLTTTGSL